MANSLFNPVIWVISIAMMSLVFRNYCESALIYTLGISMFSLLYTTIVTFLFLIFQSLLLIVSSFVVQSDAISKYDARFLLIFLEYNAKRHQLTRGKHSTCQSFNMIYLAIRVSRKAYKLEFANSMNKSCPVPNRNTRVKG